MGGAPGTRCSRVQDPGIINARQCPDNPCTTDCPTLEATSIPRSTTGESTGPRRKGGDEPLCKLSGPLQMNPCSGSARRLRSHHSPLPLWRLDWCEARILDSSFRPKHLHFVLVGHSKFESWGEHEEADFCPIQPYHTKADTP